jgi:hypothetical protein
MQKELYLSAEQRKELLDFVNKGVHDTHQIKRAKVLLTLDRTGKKDHLRITRISDQVGLSRQAIYNILNEFLERESEGIAEFLVRKKRETPPVPAKITGEVEAKIIAKACSAPPEGYTRWTIRLLASHLELDIGRSSINTFLKKRNISLTEK